MALHLGADDQAVCQVFTNELPAGRSAEDWPPSYRLANGWRLLTADLKAWTISWKLVVVVANAGRGADGRPPSWMMAEGWSLWWTMVVFELTAGHWAQWCLFSWSNNVELKAGRLAECCLTVNLQASRLPLTVNLKTVRSTEGWRTSWRLPFELMADCLTSCWGSAVDLECGGRDEGWPWSWRPKAGCRSQCWPVVTLKAIC